MKTQKQWFDEYAVSHQHTINQKIHYVCVPAIFFSIVGMFMSINPALITSKSNLHLPIVENWATVLLLVLLIFYIRLSIGTFIKMALFSTICLIGNYYISTVTHLYYFSLVLFVIAWIGQFYGHKLEGKKPSFLKDLQFLLIGPAWVFEKLTNKQ
ncbi:Mpo1 family 2-hydroxy fatty acid dioxygenase [Lutibacter sp.]